MSMNFQAKPTQVSDSIDLIEEQFESEEEEEDPVMELASFETHVAHLAATAAMLDFTESLTWDDWMRLFVGKIYDRCAGSVRWRWKRDKDGKPILTSLMKTYSMHNTTYLWTNESSIHPDWAGLNESFKHIIDD